MKQITYPIKNNWKIDEDSSIDVQTQIQRRVDSESNLEWCRKKDFTIDERVFYWKNIGKAFLKLKR